MKLVIETDGTVWGTKILKDGQPLRGIQEIQFRADIREPALVTCQVTKLAAIKEGGVAQYVIEELLGEKQPVDGTVGCDC